MASLLLLVLSRLLLVLLPSDVGSVNVPSIIVVMRRASFLLILQCAYVECQCIMLITVASVVKEDC
jgi:hypothetical protein